MFRYVCYVCGYVLPCRICTLGSFCLLLSRLDFGEKKQPKQYKRQHCGASTAQIQRNSILCLSLGSCRKLSIVNWGEPKNRVQASTKDTFSPADLFSHQTWNRFFYRGSMGTRVPKTTKNVPKTSPKCRRGDNAVAPKIFWNKNENWHRFWCWYPVRTAIMTSSAQTVKKAYSPSQATKM